MLVKRVENPNYKNISEHKKNILQLLNVKEKQEKLQEL